MIYTSRYSNPELKTGKYTVVGISRGTPRFALGYELAGKQYELAPDRSMWDKPGHIFRKMYFAKMDRLGAKAINNILERYERLGKDVVLVCYEDIRVEGEECHRRDFADWWKETTGELIEELHDPSTPKGKKKAKVAPKEEDVYYEQLSFL